MYFTVKPRSVQIDGYRFQTPKLYCEGLEFDKIVMRSTDELEKLIEPIVAEAKQYAKHIWAHNPFDGKFRAKIDEDTMVFNSRAELCDVDFVNCDVVCIIEPKTVYNFKDMSGVSYRVHQMMVFEPECMFTSQDALAPS